MRSSQVVRASDSQCRSRNCPGFDPSILRHSGIWGAKDEAVLNIVHKKKNPKKSPFLIVWLLSFHFLFYTLFARSRQASSATSFNSDRQLDCPRNSISQSTTFLKIAKRSRGNSFKIMLHLILVIDISLPVIEFLECGWDLAECGWDLADCGWDQAYRGRDPAELWMRSSRLWMGSSRVVDEI